MRCSPANCVPAISSAPRRIWPAASASAASSPAMRCERSRPRASSTSRSGRAAARASPRAMPACSPRRWRCSSILPAFDERDHGRAARHRVPRGRTRRRQLHRRAITRGCASSSSMPEGKIDDVVAFTRSSREFHLAVAEASHNRVLVVQLDLAAARVVAGAEPDADSQGGAPHSRRPQGAGLPDRDPRRRRRAPADGRPREDDRGSARRRAPRQAPSGARLLLSKTQRTGNLTIRERSTSMAREKFIIEPHFRLQEWVAEEKGYFKDEGLDYVFQETDPVDRRRAPLQGRQGRRLCSRSRRAARSDVSCACHWTVDVAASKGKGKLYADVYSVAPSGVFVPPDSPVEAPEDLAGVPISVGYQSGSHYSTIQALEQYMPARQDQPVVRRRHAVHAHGPAARRQGAGLGAVQRPVLLRRAARLPQDHRHDLHDRDHGHRRSRSGRPAQVLPRAASARSATSICGPSSTRTTTRRSSRRAITP